MRATLDTICPICDQPILKGSRLVLHKGRWIHPACAPGADDE